MRYLIYILLLLPFSVNGQTGIITTVVGNGYGGFSNRDTEATKAYLYMPMGVCIDKNENIYIPDRYNRILKVTAATGILSVVAGNGLFGSSGDSGDADSASLNQPQGVCIDTYGNIFIADTKNNKIRKVDAITKIIQTVAGKGSAGFSGDGNLADSAELTSPYAVCLDVAGNILIADGAHIRRVDRSTNIITTIAGNGTSTYSGDGIPATSAALSAYALVVDYNDNIILTDLINARVRKIDAVTGIITTIAGGGLAFPGDSGLATNARLGTPYGLGIDSENNIYFSDQTNSKIRKVDAKTNIITTICGNGTAGYFGDGGPAKSAKLSYPNGIMVSPAGNIYISDVGNSRIRKITFDHTGVNTISSQKNKIELWPNPANLTLSLSAPYPPEGETYNVSITNAVGQIVFSQQYKNAKILHIDVHTLAAGVYFIQLNGMYAGKFVKE